MNYHLQTVHHHGSTHSIHMLMLNNNHNYCVHQITVYMYTVHQNTVYMYTVHQNTVYGTPDAGL